MRQQYLQRMMPKHGKEIAMNLYRNAQKTLKCGERPWSRFYKCEWRVACGEIFLSPGFVGEVETEEDPGTNDKAS